MTHEFRVAEIFGPTIQGEGRNVGMPCHFVRFGGCDFRCKWCDTPHAVLPDLVAQLQRMTESEILEAVVNLDRGRVGFIEWVVLTGGNPGLLNLSLFIRMLHARQFKVMIETQGSTYREWYEEVDDLCFSPKPPSSGMDWSFNDFNRILGKLPDNPKPYLKVPVFDDDDLVFAEQVHQAWPHLEMFISIGNADPSLPTVSNPKPVVPGTRSITRDEVLMSFRWTLERILLRHPLLQDCRIFPQQHVLLWGNERGH